jgi:ribonuclease D
MTAETGIRFIDTQEQLKRFCEQLGKVDWIALDTEFLREKTYYPKLCLLQVATPECVACIDPLALEDLSPVLDILFDAAVTKVLHSGRQDLEIFYHLTGKVPSPVFDSQIAALLLGYPEQVGYASLVKDELGIELDKLHTRADWSLRPLSREQIQYAADDVVYLAEIYQRLCEKLQVLGRSDWLLEDFQRLTSREFYENPPEDAWRKVKGGNRLRGDSLAIMQSLASWREQLAQQKDRPKGWILRDDALVDISRHKPASLPALGKIRGLSEGLLRNSGNQIVELVREATGKTPIPFPDKGKHTKLSPDQNALLDVMMALVRLSAEQNSLNPAVLATRKQLEMLLLGDTDSAVVQGWRKQLVGRQLLEFLNGDLKLCIRDGRLTIDESS